MKIETVKPDNDVVNKKIKNEKWYCKLKSKPKNE